ncbi:hypothetical protein GCM10025771_29690 [Niveibacterium umoris]|uniref:Uncharacterized protein n=1 Tax=Niveibacterium umoris TaxID=1193620 RepID=A0A840BJS0_9RHOO|nr:hypothetical protein [Niveibacterium umoris]MBB4011838.1 hypothetical protein [Niveibacterium umoris]
MAGSRVPGPAGLTDATPVVEDGTAPRTPTPPPGPVGVAPQPQPAAAAATPETDSAIEALNLAPTARLAAYALKKAHPSVTFTSGRRGKEDQARAMASNVVKNRKWIEETYANSPLRKKCQDWVDNNPGKKTQAEIQEGLLSVFNEATDEDLGKFSKHLSGMAFDVQPVDDDAEAIKKTIRGLEGLDKFLDKEGGLVRWHAQF